MIIKIKEIQINNKKAINIKNLIKVLMEIISAMQIMFLKIIKLLNSKSK